MAMDTSGRFTEADFRKMSDDDPRKQSWLKAQKKYGEQGRFEDKKRDMEAARDRAGGSSAKKTATTTSRHSQAKQLSADYATGQKRRSVTASTNTSDRRQSMASSRTDYSASQRERDTQDRTRGSQRRGAIAEGSERMSRGSMNRETERVDRPPLSETTEVATQLHSSNRDPGVARPLATKLEQVKNRRDYSFTSTDKKKDVADRGSKFISDFTSRYKR